ncbi:DUF308 domain-containing protein [Ruegeria sp.]|uniref:DUF308 domain-containing protein n=1 Tax=Ruegeria sp. TaxID=1879320 RepID=UPI003C7E5C48
MLPTEATIVRRDSHPLGKRAFPRRTRNSGLAALAIGLVLMFWPGSGLVALGWAIAFSALAIAVVMFFLAARFKRAGDRLGMRSVNR